MQVSGYDILFWIVFTFFNAINFLASYVLNSSKSKIYPPLRTILLGDYIQLITSKNLDPFRFTVEFSLVLILSCYINFAPYHVVVTILFVIVLIFNIYQYLFRYIYHFEPILIHDLSLIKTGFSIVVFESPLKVLMAVVIFFLSILGLDFIFQKLLTYHNEFQPGIIFHLLTTIFLTAVLTSALTLKPPKRKYPEDVFARFHFTLHELWKNIKKSQLMLKSIVNSSGSVYLEKRAQVKLDLKRPAPNLFFLLIESYGSYFYEEALIKEDSRKDFISFTEKLNQEGQYSISSHFSESPTSGGLSWLAYTTLLTGFKIDNNMAFEHLLRDKHFRAGNNLMHVLRKAGYTNYNLNPTSPMDGVRVPYKEMRELYGIDYWFLKEQMDYNGPSVGFGACPPDQYSLNHAMELIEKEKNSPFSLFFLTKNSHNPFEVPDFVDDWKSLNHKQEVIGEKESQKGFLSYPLVVEYQKAMRYELDVISDFILKHGKKEDLFIVLGDHQPPMLSTPQKNGLKTPLHIISQDHELIHTFQEFGFHQDLTQIEHPISHESFYSMFLNAFSKHYTLNHSNIPDYEPNGIQL